MRDTIQFETKSAIHKLYCFQKMTNMTILPYLKTFDTVVKLGSFTAAAETLNMSKSVVSKQISMLEKHLGVQLMNRTTRRLHLTEAGETFTHYVQKVIEDLAEAEQSVMPMQTEPKGTLRLSVSHSLAYSVLPDVLLDFQRKYPEVNLNIHVTGRYVDLVQEGVDVALRTGTLEDSSLIARPILHCGYKLCATKEYWQREGLPTHPSELSTHNCLVYTSSPKHGYWQFVDDDDSELNVKVSGSLQSDEARILLRAAAEGLGVFYGPSYMLEDALASGELKSVLDSYQKTDTCVHAVYPYSKHVSPKVRVLIDYLLNTFQR